MPLDTTFNERFGLVFAKTGSINTLASIPTIKNALFYSVGYNDTGASSFSLPAAGLPGRPTGRSCFRKGQQGEDWKNARKERLSVIRIKVHKQKELISDLKRFFKEIQRVSE